MNFDYWALLIWVGFILVVFILIDLLLSVLLKFQRWRKLMARKIIFLELTPPSTITKSPESTAKLMGVIHRFHTSRTFLGRLMKQEVIVPMEIVGTKSGGVRFVLSAEKRIARQLFHHMHTYLPNVQVKEVEDFLPRSLTGATISEFTQMGDWPLPLEQHDSLEQHDPVSFITGSMAGLGDDELMSYQLIISPTKMKDATLLNHRINNNEDVLGELTRKKKGFWSKVMFNINRLLLGIIGFVSDVSHQATQQNYALDNNDAHAQLRAAKHLVPARSISVFELTSLQPIQDKVRQSLFQVDIRTLVKLNDPEEQQERSNMMRSAIEAFSAPPYQVLAKKRQMPFQSGMLQQAYRHRLPSLYKRSSCVLSASEIASLYHFPHSLSSHTDNLVSSLSRTLAAPISLKQGTELEVVLGVNEHHGVITAIGLTKAERERHVYIIGGTGNGKTTMLQSAIVQDMQSGKCIAIVDPHGDMAEKMLRHVPPERIKDVIYFNPKDIGHPIGLNILQLPKGLKGDELLDAKDAVTESVVSIFRKIFSDDSSGGHRVEYVLRNCIQTALTVPDATLFTIYDLLNDPKFRSGVVGKLEDDHLIKFWRNELGKAGDMQKVKMSAGITAKIGRFLFSASAKRVLEQPKSTIDFDDIINSGKILICNLSKGLLGEDTSELFGITVLAKLQLASNRRTRIKEEERKPFYLYVDEFQNFATTSFAEMLSESRKYKLYITMAEQSTSQQKDQQLVEIILSNAGTIICFRTGNPTDEKLILPLFTPLVGEHMILNLSRYNFYAKLGGVHAQEPMSGHTVVLADPDNEETYEQVIKESRKSYAIKVKRPKKADLVKQTTKETDNVEKLPDEK